jgi:hypothetical protein
MWPRMSGFWVIEGLSRVPDTWLSMFLSLDFAIRTIYLGIELIPAPPSSSFFPNICDVENDHSKCHHRSGSGSRGGGAECPDPRAAR